MINTHDRIPRMESLYYCCVDFIDLYTDLTGTSDTFCAASWEDAMAHAAKHMAKTYDAGKYGTYMINYTVYRLPASAYLTIYYNNHIEPGILEHCDSQSATHVQPWARYMGKA